MRRSSGLMDRMNSIDAVALLEDVAGMANLFAPGHFGDVNETFNAGLDLDKCTEVHEAGDGAGDALAGLQAVRRGGPGLSLELLEAKGDLLGVRIDF